MVICPKCRNKIPAWKLFFLTNYSTITCSTCSAKLQVKNKRISSLIGGIGGGIGGGLGGLLLYCWLYARATLYTILFIALLSIIAFVAWMATINLIKLEV